ncbi:MAG: hypothetical protein ABEJ60_01970 [Halodesulfurarchaeum sp.]
MATDTESHGRRVVKAGGPPALITAGLGVGATGVLGDGVKRAAKPVADGLSTGIGISPALGAPLLMALGVLVFVVAVFVPGLFEDRPGG